MCIRDSTCSATERWLASSSGIAVIQWLRSYYRHDRMHYDQVRGEEPAYKPQFKSGVEPDQRRGPRI